MQPEFSTVSPTKLWLKIKETLVGVTLALSPTVDETIENSGWNPWNKMATILCVIQAGAALRKE